MMQRTGSLTALLLVMGMLVAVQPAVAQGDQPRNPRVSRRAPLLGNGPQAPFPPLPKQHQEYLDQVLKYWEHSSSQIKRYRCQFTRWEYNPVFGPRQDPRTGVTPANTIATGRVQFQTPDKGMYEVQKLFAYEAPRVAGGEPQYVPQQAEGFEKWICDGKSVFEFDYQQKKLHQQELPAQLQGKAIADGPLPFLFGAKVSKIKSRYWIRVITPKDVQGEYWLEAFPKRGEDARNYKRIEIYIAQEDFLPKGMRIFPPNFNAKTNPSSTAFTFEKRDINFIDPKKLDVLQIFSRAFHSPNPPNREWQHVLYNANGQVKILQAGANRQR